MPLRIIALAVNFLPFPLNLDAQFFDCRINKVTRTIYIFKLESNFHTVVLLTQL